MREFYKWKTFVKTAASDAAVVILPLFKVNKIICKLLVSSGSSLTRRSISCRCCSRLRQISASCHVCAVIVCLPQPPQDTSLGAAFVGSTLFLHGACMLRECIYGECAHEQYVRRTLTLTLTHTITAYSVSGNVVRVRILICATRQKPCRKRIYPFLDCNCHSYCCAWEMKPSLSDTLIVPCYLCTHSLCETDRCL